MVATPKKAARKMAAKAPVPVEAPKPESSLPTVIVAVEPPKPVAPVPVPQISAPAARLTLVPAVQPPPQRKVTTMAQAVLNGAPFKGFEDFAAFGKDTLDAIVASNAVLVKGMEDFGKEFAELAQANLETAASHTKAMLSAKTLKDVVDLNAAMSKSSIEKIVAESSKLSELSMKLTTDALAPLGARVTAAVEKMMELSAA